MKKLLIGILILLLLLPTISVADTKPIIRYYGVDSCSNCKIVKSMLDSRDDIEYIYINLDTPEGYEEFQKVADHFSKLTQTPAILVGSELLVGLAEIESRFEDVLKVEIAKGYTLFDISELTKTSEEISRSTFTALNIFVIMGAGLVDGVNPCAIAMLILLLNTVMSLGRRQIVYVGVSFALGTFLTYYFIGFNLYKVLEFASNLSWLLILVYVVTILLTLGFIHLNTKDYIALKNNNFKGVKNQLSVNQKKKIFGFVDKLKTSKNIPFYGFILGVILTVLEFTCTGQVYMPTLSYIMSTNEFGILPYVYLFLYNLMFIVPLIVICVIAYLKQTTNALTDLLYTRLGFIKLLTNAFYVVIVILLSYRLVKLF